MVTRIDRLLHHQSRLLHPLICHAHNFLQSAHSLFTVKFIVMFKRQTAQPQTAEIHLKDDTMDGHYSLRKHCM